MRNFNVLLNQNIVRWVGVEEAFSEGTESGSVIWEHSSVPFMQFDRLDAFLDDGNVMTLVSQFDDGSGWFGIHTWNKAENFLKPEPYESGSIFRTRDVPEIATGKVSNTKEKLDDSGNVLELSLSVGNSIIRIVSGEVYERGDGSYWITQFDECLLIQIVASDA
jgi:hypothetical protein